GTYDYTPVNQKVTEPLMVTQSTEMTVKFSAVYPAFTSTVLFDFIVGIVVIVVAAAAAVYITFRRGRKEKGK
ncbi:MAG: hypothetical protein QXP70_01360, partial [Methanomassiliicoccales archaeon]